MEKVTTLSAPNVATSFHIVLFRLWISRNIKLNCSKVMRFIREIWLRERQLSYKMLGVYQKSAFLQPCDFCSETFDFYHRNSTETIL